MANENKNQEFNKTIKLLQSMIRDKSFLGLAEKYYNLKMEMSSFTRSLKEKENSLIAEQGKISQPVEKPVEVKVEPVVEVKPEPKVEPKVELQPEPKPDKQVQDKSFNQQKQFNQERKSYQDRNDRNDRNNNDRYRNFNKCG